MQGAISRESVRRLPFIPTTIAQPVTSPDANLSLREPLLAAAHQGQDADERAESAVSTYSPAASQAESQVPRPEAILQAQPQADEEPQEHRGEVIATGRTSVSAANFNLVTTGRCFGPFAC